MSCNLKVARGFELAVAHWLSATPHGAGPLSARHPNSDMGAGTLQLLLSGIDVDAWFPCDGPPVTI